eukprot:gene5654-5893_t
MCAFDGRSEESERWAVRTVAHLRKHGRAGDAAHLWKNAPAGPQGNAADWAAWQQQMLEWPEVFLVQQREVGLQQNAKDFLLGRPRARQLLAQYKARLLKELAEQGLGIEVGRACNTKGKGLMHGDLAEYKEVGGTAEEPHDVWACLKQLPDVFSFTSSTPPRSSSSSSTAHVHERVALHPNGLASLLNTARVRQLKEVYITALWRELRAKGRLPLTQASSPLMFGEMWPYRLLFEDFPGFAQAIELQFEVEEVDGVSCLVPLKPAAAQQPPVQAVQQQQQSRAGVFGRLYTTDRSHMGPLPALAGAGGHDGPGLNKYLDSPGQRAEESRSCQCLARHDLLNKSPYSIHTLQEYSSGNRNVFDLGSHPWQPATLHVHMFNKQLLSHPKVLNSVGDLEQLLVDIILAREAPDQAGRRLPRMQICEVLRKLQQRRPDLDAYLAVPGFLEELVSQYLQNVVALLSTTRPPSHHYQFLEVLPSAAAEVGVQLTPCFSFLKTGSCKKQGSCFKSHLDGW